MPPAPYFYYVKIKSLYNLLQGGALLTQQSAMNLDREKPWIQRNPGFSCLKGRY